MLIVCSVLDVVVHEVTLYHILHKGWSTMHILTLHPGYLLYGLQDAAFVAAIRYHIGLEVIGIGGSSLVGPHAPRGILCDAQLALVGLVWIHHDVVIQHHDIYFGHNLVQRK